MYTRIEVGVGIRDGALIEDVDWLLQVTGFKAGHQGTGGVK
jgi:hypothetical protein